MEWQPYLNLPIYVVHPIDGEECSCSLHRNYMLPISNNLEQEAGDHSVRRDGPSDKPTPVPHENDVLPVYCPTKSQPKGMLNSPSEHCKLFDPGSAGSTSMDPTDEGLQANNDASIPPRQSLRTRNQPLWSYWNFALQQNDILPDAFNIWLGLCMFLHIISCVHMVFVGNTV